SELARIVARTATKTVNTSARPRQSRALALTPNPWECGGALPRPCPSLVHAVARKIVDDLRLDNLGSRDIGLTAGCIALLEPGKPASIERARKLRLDAQRQIIIVDGGIELAHLQIDQSTRIVRRGIVRFQLKRLVAVRQRVLQLTDDGAGPAAPIPYGFHVGLEADCLAVVPGGAVEFVLYPVSFGTVGESVGIVGIELDRLVEIFDRTVVIALLPINYTAVVEWFRVIRIELDRLVVILDCAVVIPLRGIGVATVVERDRHDVRRLVARIDERRAAIDLRVR